MHKRVHPKRNFQNDVVPMKQETKRIRGETGFDRMTEEEFWYLVGVFDGCGTFTLNRNGELEISIEKKSDLAKQVALKFGGLLCIRYADESHDYCRFRWLIRGKEAEALLTKLGPCLKSNKRKIEVKLLLETLSGIDDQRFREIRAELGKNMTKRIEESAEKDKAWFKSLPQHEPHT